MEGVVERSQDSDEPPLYGHSNPLRTVTFGTKALLGQVSTKQGEAVRLNGRSAPCRRGAVHHDEKWGLRGGKRDLLAFSGEERRSA